MEIAAIILATVALTISGIQFATSHRPFVIFDIDRLEASDYSKMLLPFTNTGSISAIINSAQIRRAGGKWVSFTSITTRCEPDSTFSYVVNSSENPFGADGNQSLVIEYEIEYQSPFAFSVLRRRFGHHSLVDSIIVNSSTVEPPVLPLE